MELISKEEKEKEKEQQSKYILTKLIQIVTQATKSIHEFNVRILIDKYNEYKNACDNLQGKNIVLLIGSNTRKITKEVFTQG